MTPSEAPALPGGWVAPWVAGSELEESFQKGKMREQHLEHDQKVNSPFQRELKRSWSSSLPGAPPRALSQRRHGPDDETPFQGPHPEHYEAHLFLEGLTEIMNSVVC